MTKFTYNCSAFVQTKSNPDAFINREVIATSLEEAQQKFNQIIEQYSFVRIDLETISVRMK